MITNSHKLNKFESKSPKNVDIQAQLGPNGTLDDTSEVQ